MELRRRLDELQHRIRILMNRRAMLEEQRQTDIANWEAMQRKAAGMRHDFGKHSVANIVCLPQPCVSGPLWGSGGLQGDTGRLQA